MSAQAHEQLEEETLQLCAAITDRYLARSAVPLPRLQLVGITCLLIAAKFVERFPPLVSQSAASSVATWGKCLRDCNEARRESP